MAINYAHEWPKQHVYKIGALVTLVTIFLLNHWTIILFYHTDKYVWCYTNYIN